MENQQKLTRRLPCMDFKCFILFAFMGFILFSGFQCGNEETENELRIVNETSDTLVFCITCRIPYDSIKYYRERFELYPYENFLLAGSKGASVAELIRTRTWDKHDSIEIFKTVCITCNGSPFFDRSGNIELFMGNICYVKWGAPIVSLPDVSKTCGVITKNGAKNAIRPTSRRLVGTGYYRIG